MKKIRNHTLILFMAICLTACNNKWWKSEDDSYNPYQGMTAKQLYKEAQEALRKEQYSTATKKLEALESMYPFNDHAEKAQMELIYAYYKNDEYLSCAATAQRFIQLYPRSKHVDYAYYMKGLANFQQLRGTLGAVLPIDESWRDPGTQAQAYADFSLLIQRFPESRYKANALQRMIYLRNMFAQRELNTSKYYFERKRYVAAAERANFLLKNYEQAPSAQEALAILYYSNKALGLKKASEDVLRVYQETYHSQPVKPAFSQE